MGTPFVTMTLALITLAVVVIPTAHELPLRVLVIVSELKEFSFNVSRRP